MPLIPFDAQRRLSRSRMAGLRAAFPDSVMPAINVFEVGGAYFVEDDHHRVALARERGAHHIDAEVTRLETASWNPTDADLCLWVYEIRRDLRAQDEAIDFGAAATHARGAKHHERSRRQTLRGGSRPLARRPPTTRPNTA